MTFQLMKEIRALIADHYGLRIDPESGTVVAEDNPESPVRDIQLFNEQFSTNIVQVPVILMACGKLEFEEYTKGNWRSPLQVQLMVVSDKISLSDGQSHDKDLEEHESIVDDCVTLLHKHKFFASSKLMILQSSETIYDHQGYMVTSLIFKTAISI